MKQVVPKFITLQQVAGELGVSYSSAYRYTQQPDFPEAFKFSRMRIVWSQAEVHDWIERRRRRRG